MIQPNLPRAARRMLQKEQAIHGKQNAQHALNTVLWKIVMENGGAIKVPCSTLKGLPIGAVVETKYDKATDSMIIVAGIRDPKIITLNNGLITET